MSLSGNTAPNNSPTGGPPPLWRRLATPFLRWPVTIGMSVLALFIARDPLQFVLFLAIGALLDVVIRLCFRTHDIREEVRTLNDGGMTRCYRLCTMACRYYITAIFGLTALFGAANWLVAALLLLTGLVIDAVRARWSPDIYLDIRQFADDLDRAAAGQPRLPVSRRRLRDMLILWAVFVAYMIVLLSSAAPSSPETLQGYMALFTPLHDLTALFLNSSRRVVGQLTDIGLPDRARLAAHVFTICWFILIVSVIWVTPAVYDLMILVEKAKTTSEIQKNNVSFWAVIMGLVVVVVFYWLLCDLLSVTFTPKRKANFHVHQSNGPYHFPVGMTLMVAFSFCGVYLQLVRLRLQLWRGWQERQAAAPDPSATSGS